MFFVMSKGTYFIFFIRKEKARKKLCEVYGEEFGVSTIIFKISLLENFDVKDAPRFGRPVEEPT